PTVCRVACPGIFGRAPALAHIGPMTRSARDAAIVLEPSAGHDRLDPTSSLEPTAEYSRALRLSSTPLVGFDRELAHAHFDEATNAMLETTIETLSDL